MRISHELKKAFYKLTPDFELIDQLIKNNPEEYIRKRLKAIRLLWEGRTKKEVMEKLDIHRTALQNWIRAVVDKGVEDGIKYLSRKMRINKPCKLNTTQQEEIIQMVENESPHDYGYVNNVFTGDIIVRIIKQKYQIDVSDQLVYNMFKRHGFSYQKAHRDYENADPEKQKKYCELVKKNWTQKKKKKK